nr:hypothetical protein [Janthinobacterium sp. Marseille]
MRKFDTSDFIHIVLTHLRWPVAAGRLEAEKMPWIALLAIKWALADPEAFAKGRATPSKNDVYKVMDDIYQIGDVGYMPDDFADVHLFMKAMAVQQFYLQFGPALHRINRQLFLFGDLPKDHRLAIEFKKITKVDINQYLICSALLMLHYNDPNTAAIDIEQYKATMGQAFSHEDIDAFLASLTTTFDNAVAVIRTRDQLIRDAGGLPRSPLEFFEQSYFQRYPFLMLDSKPTCIERHLLYRSLEYVVFDRLREIAAETFMEDFGPVFERYVEMYIRHARLDFYTELQLRDHYKPKQGTKEIDFVITEKEGNVFVDAKGIELHYEGKVALTFEQQIKWYKTSLTKAVVQAHDALRMINDSTRPALVRSVSANYLIVVTYKELYVGHGVRLIDVIGQDAFDVLVAPYEESLRIHPSHMYFMTIDEFEMLMCAVEEGKTTVVGSLELSKAADQSPQTGTYDYSQHLTKQGIHGCFASFSKQKFRDVAAQFIQIPKQLDI